MSFKTDNFRALMQGNLASANRWRVQLPTLVGKTTMSGSTPGFYNSVDLNLVCTNARLPGKRITTVDRQIGLVRQTPAVGFESGEAAFTFYLDDDLTPRRWAQDWLNCVVSNQPPYEVGFLHDYVEDITIRKLDRDNNETYFMTLIDCFPVNIAEVELNNAAQTTAIELTITVAYKDYSAAFSF